MGAVIIELHNKWKLVVLTNLNWVAMNCIVYIMSCNSAIHATCLLTFMAYKYNELQVSFVT
jgi:hypothetical protein